MMDVATRAQAARQSAQARSRRYRPAECSAKHSNAPKSREARPSRPDISDASRATKRRKSRSAPNIPKYPASDKSRRSEPSIIAHDMAIDSVQASPKSRSRSKDSAHYKRQSPHARSIRIQPSPASVTKPLSDMSPRKIKISSKISQASRIRPRANNCKPKRRIIVAQNQN